jgi:Mn-dependent DtxR family transcriptional regulator
MTANTATITDIETGEQRLVNTHFSQVYDSSWPAFRTLLDENPSALKVLTWLIEKADKRNAILVSFSAIAKGMGVHTRTAQYAIAHLRAKKYITVLKSGNMNVYVLNDRIVWKDTADMKDKYSQFSAEVYIVASEQEELYRTQLIGHAIAKPSTNHLDRKLKTKDK